VAEEVLRSELFSVVTEEDQTINLKISPSRSRELSRSPSPAVSRQSDDVNGQSHPRINENRMSLTSNRSIEGQESFVSSRSTSPHHRVDVPRGVEDGSDSETSGDGRPTLDQHHLSSAPVSDNDNFDVYSPSLSEDASVPSQHDVSDDLSESSPVERTSHATFIAPALPPIRFSLNTTDFAEFLSSVQGNKLKSFDQMTTVLQESDGPSTPKASHGSSEKDLTAVTPQAKTADEPKQLHLQQSFSELLLEERQTLSMYVAKADTFTHLNCLYRPPEMDRIPSSENKSLSTLNLSLDDVEAISIISEPSKSANDLQITESGSSENSLISQLHGIIKGSREQGVKQIQLDVDFVENVAMTLESRKTVCDDLKEKFDGMKVAFLFLFLIRALSVQHRGQARISSTV